MIERVALLASIAAKHIVHRRRQTLVAVLGVAVGVGFFLAVSALMVGSQRDFIRTLIDAAPHIVISDEIRSPRPQPGSRLIGGAVALHGYKIRSEARGLKDWQSILAAVDAVPGAVASPSLTGAIALQVGGRQQAVTLIGIEPGLQARVSTIEDNLRTGHLRDLETTQGGIILGEDLATRLGLSIGDIVGATAAGGKQRSLRLVGLLKKGRAEFTSSTGYVLLREAQSLLGRPFIINAIGVKLPDPYQAQLVAQRLEARFGYRSESWQERSADILSLLVTRNVIMYSVVSAILLVASFGIYTAVSNGVADKRRDIAIMRSMGFSQGDVELVFVLEGVTLAVVGILLGWLLGTGLMQVLGMLNFPVGGEVEHIPIDRSPLQYGIAAAASLAAGSIAAWLPARKAARVDPVDILRGAV